MTSDDLDRALPDRPPIEGAFPLEGKGLTLDYGRRTVIDNLDVAVPTACVTVLVGSNGCGKSTLLKAMARLLKPKAGVVILNGTSIHQKSTSQVARELAVLPQTPLAPDGLTVEQLVRMGRYPHQSWLQQWTKQDQEKVDSILEATELQALRSRPVDELSGGQRQRAWIAMTLAQDTDLLLLDEPTTYLDLAHQIDILDLLHNLNVDHGKTILMVLHDLNLAARYAHHMIAMRDGGIHTQGAPGEIFTESMVKAVFGLDCRIIEDPVFGTPLCIPMGRRRTGAGRG